MVPGCRRRANSASSASECSHFISFIQNISTPSTPASFKRNGKASYGERFSFNLEFWAGGVFGLKPAKSERERLHAAAGEKLHLGSEARWTRVSLCLLRPGDEVKREDGWRDVGRGETNTQASHTLLPEEHHPITPQQASYPLPEVGQRHHRPSVQSHRPLRRLLQTSARCIKLPAHGGSCLYSIAA